MPIFNKEEISGLTEINKVKEFAKKVAEAAKKLADIKEAKEKVDDITNFIAKVNAEKGKGSLKRAKEHLQAAVDAFEAANEIVVKVKADKDKDKDKENGAHPGAGVKLEAKGPSLGEKLVLENCNVSMKIGSANFEFDIKPAIEIKENGYIISNNEDLKALLVKQADTKQTGLSAEITDQHVDYAKVNAVAILINNLGGPENAHLTGDSKDVAFILETLHGLGELTLPGNKVVKYEPSAIYTIVMNCADRDGILNNFSQSFQDAILTEHQKKIEEVKKPKGGEVGVGPGMDPKLLQMMFAQMMKGAKAGAGNADVSEQHPEVAPKAAGGVKAKM